MRKRLFFLLFGIVMSLNGAQLPTTNKNTLLEALRLTKKGQFVVCRYNEKKTVTGECQQALKELRDGDVRQLIDYIVVGSQMVSGDKGMWDKGGWEYESRNIQEIIDLRKSSGYKRGIVIYNITLDCKKYAVNNYVEEIKSLQEESWKVLVHAHSAAIPDDFERNFPSVNTFILPDAPKKNDALRNILIMGAFVIVFTFIFSKLGGR
jgi:hypothetical protein